MGCLYLLQAVSEMSVTKPLILSSTGNCITVNTARGDIHETAQQALEERMRPKADFMVAIFGSRMGVETKEVFAGFWYQKRLYFF